MSRRRLIHTVTHTTAMGTNHSAKVYRVAEFNEWQVDFYFADKVVNNARYYGSDKQDAIETAERHIKRISEQFA